MIIEANIDYKLDHHHNFEPDNILASIVGPTIYPDLALVLYINGLKCWLYRIVLGSSTSTIENRIN